MNDKRTRLLLTGVAAWISLLLTITTACAGSIVIGGDYTDVGTIVIVSPKPGDSVQANGTALLNNLEDIPGGASHPYLIKLGPGIYDIGINSLQMKEYVDIEGAGENTTVISGNIDSYDLGVVQGANHAEIRFLTIQNTGGGTNANATAISNNGASPKITNVTASASGGTGGNHSIYNNSYSLPVLTNVTASALGGNDSINRGVHNVDHSSPTMTNVTASASGGNNSYMYGVYNSGLSSTTMTNVTASASVKVTPVTNSAAYGVWNDSSYPTMMNVTASATGATDNYGVYNWGSGFMRINNSVIVGSPTICNEGTQATTLVANTKLDGSGVDLESGTLKCVGAYDGNHVALGTNCLPLP
jgi:hypothetical protein